MALIQGLGAGFIPKNLNRAILDEVIAVSDNDALETARSLASQEGLLCGISTGATVWAALQLARRQEFFGKTIVTSARAAVSVICRLRWPTARVRMSQFRHPRVCPDFLGGLANE